MQERNLPEIRIGGNVLVREGEKILLVQRKGKFGHGTWCFPGGHMEDDETIIDVAIREAQEEVGIIIQKENMRFIGTSDNREGDTVRVQFLYEALSYEGVPVNNEVDEAYQVGFFAMDNLPEIFSPHKPLIQYIR